MVESGDSGRFDPAAITRPDGSLLFYYFITALAGTVFFPVVFLPLYFKYHTLRYRFDDEGISMSWGILFRREIYLTYRRIQDIHVERNLLHRWLGLAKVDIQTASGSAGAEMSIEGITKPERLRDFLYSKMRGAREDEETGGTAQGSGGAEDEALTLLREIRDALRNMGGKEEAGT